MQQVLQKVVRTAYSGFGHLYPFMRTARVFHNPLAIWLTSQIRGSTVVNTRDGYEMLVIPAELIGRQIYLTGTFDPHLLILMKSLARDKRVFVDVGAHVGLFSISLARSNSALLVHAVEPQPTLASMISESAVMAGVRPRLQVHQCAVSDIGGSARFEINETNLGHSRLAGPGSAGSGIRVDVVNGCKLLEATGEQFIDLLKVDVEGHELRVFRSIEPWLRDHRIGCIVAEARGHGDDVSVVSLLRHHSFELFSIRKGLVGPVIQELSGWNNEPYEDILAVRPQDVAQVRSVIEKWLRPPT